MEIRRQIAVAAAAAEAPAATDFPSNDEMRHENQIIRDQVGATAGVAGSFVEGAVAFGAPAAGAAAAAVGSPFAAGALPV